MNKIRLSNGEKEKILFYISEGYSLNKISFATVSPGLKDNISEVLKLFNFNYSVREYQDKRPNRVLIYHIDVFRKDHQRFINLINPRNKWELKCTCRDSNIRTPSSQDVSRITGSLLEKDAKITP